MMCLAEHGLFFIETSAMDASNVEAAFQNILTGKSFYAPDQRIHVINTFVLVLCRGVPNCIQQSSRIICGPDQAHRRRDYHCHTLSGQQRQCRWRQVLLIGGIGYTICRELCVCVWGIAVCLVATPVRRIRVSYLLHSRLMSFVHFVLFN